MKFLIINDQSNKNNLSKSLEEYYEIKRYDLNELLNNNTEDNIKTINKINKENKEYIIESDINNNLNIIYNLVNKIIITIKDNNKYKEIINKYPKKVIILKNNKEIKKYLKSVYNNKEW